MGSIFKESVIREKNQGEELLIKINNNKPNHKKEKSKRKKKLKDKLNSKNKLRKKYKFKYKKSELKCNNK